MAGLPALAGLGGWHELGLFMAAVFVLNATPGVDLLLTLTRTLQGGARAGIAAALGIHAGCVVHAVAAAFGLAALLAVSATAFAVLKGLGAAYLLWLAAGLLREAWAGRPLAVGDTASPPRSLGADFRTGLLTNVLNPKVVLFFLAFLPQFIHPDTVDKTAAFLVLGAVFVVQSTLFLAVVVALAAQARRLAMPAGLGRGLRGVGGLVMAGLAVRLALASPGKA